MAPDYIFTCRKCEHVLYVSKFAERKLSTLHDYHCPCCGEEGHMNWIVNGEGDYADFEGEKIGTDENPNGWSNGCCGKHEHSDEEGF